MSEEKTREYPAPISNGQLAFWRTQYEISGMPVIGPVATEQFGALLSRLAKAETDRDDARKLACRTEAFRRNGNGGMFIAAYTETAHDVCKRLWPDEADRLFPKEKK